MPAMSVWALARSHPATEGVLQATTSVAAIISASVSASSRGELRRPLTHNARRNPVAFGMAGYLSR
jgi:hypothetical protein